nr:diacylglycerol kinase family lipid kinase [Propionibacterium sp.]
MSAADPSPTRVFAILNPARRRWSAARRLLEEGAAARGWPLTVLTTTVADPGAGQARAALDAGATLVVVGGGDGTVRVVGGVLAGSGVPLGIVPLGTANLFARNLGLRPRALARNVATALAGRPHRVDVGWSRHRRGEEWSAEEPFLFVAGLGHDAATVLATRAWLKRWLRWLAYLGAGAVHLFRSPIPVRLAVDGRPPREVRTWCVLAGNCGRLPGGIRVFPDARPDDGVLDTLVVPIRRPWQWASVAAKGLLRLKRDVRALEYGRAHDLVVQPDTPQPLQLDGDAVEAVDEAAWRVAASELTVLIPTDPSE